MRVPARKRAKPMPDGIVHGVEFGSGKEEDWRMGGGLRRRDRKGWKRMSMT